MMPVTDWQFWVVTAIALAAISVIARTILPRRSKQSSKRVNLTIGRSDDRN